MKHGICAQSIAVLSLCLLGGAVEAAPIISDDFNDGNDNGWTQFDPNRTLFEGVAGQYASFDASANVYRIQSFGSDSVGSPSRAASYRADQTYTDFRITVDLVGFNASLDQRFGVLARLRQVELSDADGYFLSYNPSPGRAAGGLLQIYRLTNELPTAIGTGADVNPALLGSGQYKFEFTGIDDDFTARILSSTGTVLGMTSATDSTYAEGFTGLLVTNRNNGASDATFDNFVAVPEPGSLALVGLAVACAAVRRGRRPRHGR